MVFVDEILSDFCFFVSMKIEITGFFLIFSFLLRFLLWKISRLSSGVWGISRKDVGGIVIFSICSRVNDMGGLFDE